MLPITLNAGIAIPPATRSNNEAPLYIPYNVGLFATLPAIEYIALAKALDDNSPRLVLAYMLPAMLFN